MSTRLLAVLLAALALGPACSRPKQESASKPAPASAVSPVASARAAGGIEVVDVNGASIFRLEPDGTGYKLYQAADRLPADVKVGKDEIKITNTSGATVFRIRRKEAKAKAEDGSGAVAFNIKPSRKQGAYKLEDPDGAALFHLKRESYGCKVSDADGHGLYKLRIASLRFATGRVIAETDDGRYGLEVRGTDDALAASAATLDKFDVVERAGLLVYLARFETAER
jgi:hypothetical protein